MDTIDMGHESSDVTGSDELIINSGIEWSQAHLGSGDLLSRLPRNTFSSGRDMGDQTERNSASAWFRNALVNCLTELILPQTFILERCSKACSPIEKHHLLLKQG